MRYVLIITILGVLGVAVVVKAGIIMFGERDYWTAVQSRLVTAGIVPAKRGDILSDDGSIMTSTVPKYKIYMDFVANKKNCDEIMENYEAAKKKGNEKKMNEYLKKDSAISLTINMDEICKGMARIIGDPEWNAARFKEQFNKGIQSQSRYFLLYPKRISYTQFKDLKELPVLCKGSYATGFQGEAINLREWNYGSLARRILGDLYAGKDSACNGIELKYDTLLRGKPGRQHTQKVGRSNIAFIDIPAQNGYDIQTTLNVELQDICEKALRDQLETMKATFAKQNEDLMRKERVDGGLCILMDVKTGDIKAMANLNRTDDGFAEREDNAITDLMEPGSIMKTAAMTVALNDSVVHINDKFDTGGGSHVFYGGTVKDTHGYGVITAAEILKFSSNIGIGLLIDKFYRNKPDSFCNQLVYMGLKENFNLLPNESTSIIHSPKSYKLWSPADLVAMSRGYGIQVPAINMIAFYNALAGNGRLVKPRLVTRVLKDGQVVQEYPVEVLREKICSDYAIKNIHEMLRRVVNEPRGTGKRAKTTHFISAGKTGTARIRMQGGSSAYQDGEGNNRHLLSFCGFFPYEDPQYTLIVQIRVTNMIGAGGGGTSGVVFNHIAERVMARQLAVPIENAVDTVGAHTPVIKSGNLNDAYYVLKELGVTCSWKGNSESDEPIWGQSVTENEHISFTSGAPAENTVPNVMGMGAKDAVFLMEKAGLRVTLSGMGRVVAQSPQAGGRAQKGGKATLILNK